MDSSPSAPATTPARAQSVLVLQGGGALEGSVKHVRTFGPILRAEVALCGGGDKTVIEIDAPRDRELQPGDTVSLQPRRYRIFAAQD